MRPLKDVSKEENFRPQVIGPGMVTTMRTPVEPEPVGSIVLVPFRVTGYEVDDNGNCKAQLEQVKCQGRYKRLETRGKVVTVTGCARR